VRRVLRWLKQNMRSDSVPTPTIHDLEKELLHEQWLEWFEKDLEQWARR
jgi:hypothetical protein